MDKLEEFFVPIIMFVPITVILTFSLPFFWRWFEQTTGIESMGHFGPALWCFIVVYALLMLIHCVNKYFFHKKLA